MERPIAAGSAGGESPTIDRFIARGDISERHETLVNAPAELVFDVAEHLDLMSLPIVAAIFRLREVFMRAAPAPADRPRGIVAETTSIGWGLLARTPGREIVMGAVAQPWIGNVVFRAVPPERFAGFSEPDLVKIVWTLEAEPLGPARARFRTRTRALATDESARRKFLAYWRKVGVGIVLIRVLALPAVRREAERRFRARTGAR
jgi:hypothetical protein